MTRCVVLGANGQDGSYLCESLAAQGAEVWGLARQPGWAHEITSGLVHYRQVNLRDHDALMRQLAEIAPQEIFHLAAVHGAAGHSYEEHWDAALDVNVKSMHAVLEHLRRHGGRAVYASSAKAFGTPLAGTISVASPRRADCLYATTKIAAENLIGNYRRTHGVHCGIAFLFNHESPRRGGGYFIPQIIAILQAALADRSYQSSVATLDFFCDWGCAREYMDFLSHFPRLDQPLDALLATGRTWKARDFVAALFQRHGLDYHNHVQERLPPQSPVNFHADLTATEMALGRVPSRDILDVCADFPSLGAKTDLR